MSAYIIESHRDGLVVTRQSHGFSVLVASVHPAYRFATLRQAELALSGLKSSIGLHNGFKIRQQYEIIVAYRDESETEPQWITLTGTDKEGVRAQFEEFTICNHVYTAREVEA